MHQLVQPPNIPLVKLTDHLKKDKVNPDLNQRSRYISNMRPTGNIHIDKMMAFNAPNTSERKPSKHAHFDNNVTMHNMSLEKLHWSSTDNDDVDSIHLDRFIQQNKTISKKKRDALPEIFLTESILNSNKSNKRRTNNR